MSWSRGDWEPQYLASLGGKWELGGGWGWGGGLGSQMPEFLLSSERACRGLGQRQEALMPGVSGGVCRRRVLGMVRLGAWTLGFLLGSEESMWQGSQMPGFLRGVEITFWRVQPARLTISG